MIYNGKLLNAVIAATFHANTQVKIKDKSIELARIRDYQNKILKKPWQSYMSQ